MPVHHLHDGPFYVSRFKAKPISPKPKASLAALQWAAEKAGQSYGVYTLNLTEADQRRIQAEYEAFQAEQRRETAAREKRVDTTPPSPETSILTDEDV